MLDHVSLGITDIDRSRCFYDAVLRPLGLVRIVDFGEGRGSDYGTAAGSVGVEFTITREAGVRTPIPGAHVCFSNRPFEVKHFQTIRHCSVDVAHGLALLFGIGTRAPFHHGIQGRSRTIFRAALSSV